MVNGLDAGGDKEVILGSSTSTTLSKCCEVRHGSTRTAANPIGERRTQPRNVFARFTSSSTDCRVVVATAPTTHSQRFSGSFVQWTAAHPPLLLLPRPPPTRSFSRRGNKREKERLNYTVTSPIIYPRRWTIVILTGSFVIFLDGATRSANPFFLPPVFLKALDKPLK